MIPPTYEWLRAQPAGWVREHLRLLAADTNRAPDTGKIDPLQMEREMAGG